MSDSIGINDFIAVPLVIARNAVTKQSSLGFYLHGLPRFIKNIPLAKTVNVKWNCYISIKTPKCSSTYKKIL
jgi:hypothetical protein